MLKKIHKYFNSYTDIYPLVVFRILFGLLMFISIIRFWQNGWIKTIYIDPIVHFKYYGFEWVKSLEEWNYILFLICAISSIFITIGYKYRIASILFFFSFTYIELIDKTTYLNHYYFVSIISFILIFLPANIYGSIDAIKNKVVYNKTPKWSIDIIKLMLFIIYFYAGIAKINSDWLLKAMPLSVWLPGKYDLPLIGGIMTKNWVPFFMSWCGMFYDVLIGFFLFSKCYRNIAYVFVLIFHSMTAIFFPSIGMFPYIMIVSSFIFLDNKFHKRILNRFDEKWIKNYNYKVIENYKIKFKRPILIILSLFMIIQILLPFRYLLYDSELFWSEEGYRFSWRVMLIEKAGHSTFTIVDNKSKKRIVVENSDFLTSFQEKQMSFQPDMILEYAHIISEYYKKIGFTDPSVYVDSYVTLNGRLSKQFIKNNIDLSQEKESFKSKDWIIKFNDEIKGF